MKIKTGSRLRSQVCSTEVIVVRAPTEEIELCCGGLPMIDIKAKVRTGGAPAEGLSDGTLLGKRYTDADGRLEVLVTKPGDGTLTVNGARLTAKESKPLPSSD